LERFDPFRVEEGYFIVVAVVAIGGGGEDVAVVGSLITDPDTETGE